MRWRVLSVSGWSGPWTRRWSGSNSRYSRSASARPPPRRSRGRCGGASPACRGGRARGGAAGPGAARGIAAALGASPASPVQWAMSWCVPSVSGWSGPRKSAARSGSTSRYSRMALGRVPRLAGPVGDAVGASSACRGGRAPGRAAGPGAIRGTAAAPRARPPPRRSSGRCGGASPACRGDQVRGALPVREQLAA